MPYLYWSLLVFALAGVCDASEILAEARELHAKGKFSQAAGKYQEVISSPALRQQHPAALFELGEVCYNQKQWTKAMAQWRKLAADHKTDALAPKAMWRIATMQSGPMGKPDAALKAMQELRLAYPRDEYGERAAYGEALLHLWGNRKPRAREAASRYLSEYPQGKFVKAVHNLLEEVK